MRSIGIGKVAAFYASMGLLAVAAMWHQGDLSLLSPGPHAGAWFVHIAAGLAVGLTLVFLSRLASAHFGWARRLSNELASVIGELSTREALLLGVLSGFGEEALFRGVVQPAIGLWLASAVFGVLHVGPNRNFAP